MSTLPGIPLPLPPHVVRSSWVDEKGVLSDAAQKTMNSLPQLLGGKVTTHYEDTQKKRLTVEAAKFADGTTWKESDTGITYASVGTDWKYHSGYQSVTSDALPTGLGASDAGLLVEVTDFNHLLRWVGNGWDWYPGSDVSGYIVLFLIAPSGVGWQACDGTTEVAWLHSDGTLTFPDMPVIAPIAGTAGFFFRQ